MISIIYPYKNKEIARVDNSLKSLAQQTNKNFKVIIVDFGSDVIYREQLEQLVVNYSFVKLIYSYNVDQLWSRSEALNIGLKNCDTDYVFISDIDMLFESHFVELLYSHIQEDRLTYFKVAYLSENQDYSSLDFKNYSIDSYSEDYAMGMCLFPLKKAIEIRGYDEFFKIWGGEDNDFIARMRNAGLTIRFYQNEVGLFHQYHLPHKLSGSSVPSLYIDNFDQIHKKKLIYNGADKITVNKYSWGEIKTKNDYHDVLQVVNEEVITINKPSIDFLVGYYLKNIKESTRFIFIEPKKAKSKKDRLKSILKFVNESNIYNLYELNQLLLKLIVFNLSSMYNYTYEILDDKLILTLGLKKD